MSEAAAVQSRLIGAIFVERGLLTEAQLAEALEKQRSTSERLGEILVADYGVSRLELASVLAEQWAELERADPKVQVAAAGTVAAPPPLPVAPVADGDDSRRPIGEIFVERGFITQEQLDRALEAQALNGKRLGEVLVEQGSISRLDLAGALAEQWASLQKLRPPEPKPASAEPWQQRSALETSGATQEARIRNEDAMAELGELRESLATLDERLGAAEREADTTAGWRDEMAATGRSLASRLDGIEARLDGSATRDEVEALAALRHVVDDLQARSAEPISRIEAIEERLAGSVDAASVAALQRAVDELRSGLQTDLGDKVAALSARIDGVETGAADGFAVDELRREVHRLADLALPVQHLPEELTTLRQRLDHLAAAQGVPSDLVAVETELVDLRRRVDEVAISESRLAQLSAQVDGLVALERLAPDDVRQLVDAVDRAGSERLQAHEIAIHGRIDALAAGAATREDVEAIVRTLAVVEAGATSESLSSWVAEIAARVEAVADADGEALADLRATVDHLRQQTEASLEQRLAGVDARLADFEQAVRHRVDEVVSVERASREGVSVRLDDVVKRVAELQVLAERVERIDVQLQVLDSTGEGDLRGRLDEIQMRMQQATRRQEELLVEAEAFSSRLTDVAEAAPATLRRIEELKQELEQGLAELGRAGPDGVTRPELHGLAGDLRAQIGGLEAQLAELARASDEVPGRVGALESQVSVLANASDLEALRGDLTALVPRPELHSLAGDLQAQLGQLDRRVGEVAEALELAAFGQQLASERAAIDELAQGLAGARAAQVADGAALRAAIETVADRLAAQESLAVELAVVRESVAQLTAAHDRAAAELDADHLAGMVERQSLLDARLESIADGLERLRTESLERADQTALEIGEVAARIDDVAERATGEAARMSITLGQKLDDQGKALAERLDKATRRKQRNGTEHGERLDRLERAVEELGERDAAQAKSIERAIRKSLRSLAEQIVDGEATYVNATDSFRRSIDRLGLAIADAQPAGAPADAPDLPTGSGYLAFVPTSKGYKLTDIKGVPGAIGDRIKAPDGSGKLIVSRIARSPLPFDDRPCVYFERS